MIADAEPWMGIVTLAAASVDMPDEWMQLYRVTRKWHKAINDGAGLAFGAGYVCLHCGMIPARPVEAPMRLRPECRCGLQVAAFGRKLVGA